MKLFLVLVFLGSPLFLELPHLVLQVGYAVFKLLYYQVLFFQFAIGFLDPSEHFPEHFLECRHSEKEYSPLFICVDV